MARLDSTGRGDDQFLRRLRAGDKEAWSQFVHEQSQRLDSPDPAVSAGQQLAGGGGRFVVFAGHAETSRQIAPETNVLHGDSGAWIRSEACLCLDFGAERLPGLLVLGSEDPHQFAPSHGTDLLTFFAGAFERAMRRWLA